MEDNRQETPLDEQETHPASPAHVFKPVRVRFVLLTQLAFSVLLTIAGALLLQLLARLGGWDESLLSGELPPDASAAARWQMRLLLAVSQISTFLLAGWMTLRLLYPPAARSLDYLKARHFPDIRLLLPGLLLMLVSMPFVMYLYEINKALPLPELFRSMEDKTAGTLRELLRMDTSLELWANLGLIALLPALGEELVFRGVLQQQLLRRFRYPWEAMLLAAAIFSFAHLQFEGFLPRMALGLVLGWLYWRTGNFWIPAAAHFVNNGAQVLAQFLYSRGLFPFDLEQDIVVFWPFALASLLLALALMYWINHICRRQTLLPS